MDSLGTNGKNYIMDDMRKEFMDHFYFFTAIIYEFDDDNEEVNEMVKKAMLLTANIFSNGKVEQHHIDAVKEWNDCMKKM